MRLVLPLEGLILRGEKDRLIIETNVKADNDRDLDRREVAARLGKTVRMVDVYRRLDGEARLQSEYRNHRIVIKESELARWREYIDKNGHLVRQTYFDGSVSSFRPRKTRRSRMANLVGDLSGIPHAPDTAGIS